MTDYFVLLDLKYLLPIVPITIFSYDEPKRLEKSQYTVNFPHHKVLEFNYVAIQLNRLNCRDFLKQPNPVTSALMSKMNFRWKIKLIVYLLLKLKV